MKRNHNEEEMIESKEEQEHEVKKQKTENGNAGEYSRRKCPYLDTINRHLLDFDMEKVCSVTLSNMNVYCCLVCGKFFSGRGKTTPAYTHSLQASHFVYMNLHTSKAYCLPDNYEIIDTSLDDIKQCLTPTYSPLQLSKLDQNTLLCRDKQNNTYLPGFIGLNNLNSTDYISCSLLALAHIPPIRDFFLLADNYKTCEVPLVLRFGEVMRKIWSSGNFKSVVTPQEFVQAVIVASNNKFTIGKRSEINEFLIWLLNQLHIGLGGTRKANSSVIYRAFQGQVRVRTRVRRNVKISANEELGEGEEVYREEQKVVESTTLAPSDYADPTAVKMTEKWEETVQDTPFLYLTLDLPPTPLFRDTQGGLIIPQIPLFQVLSKLDGVTWTDSTSIGTMIRKQYTITQLPPYLLLHLGRFSKNNFYLEKNSTIVTFPVKNLEMKDYYTASTSTSLPALDSIPSLSIAELRQLIKKYGTKVDVAAAGNALEKTQLIEAAVAAVTRLHAEQGSKYDLVANIVHELNITQDSALSSMKTSASATAKKSTAANVLDEGAYHIHLHNKTTNQWFEIRDLTVSETMPQLIGLSESNMLIYERKTSAAPLK